MFALVDCNSFFCSVERVFHPGLQDKPVVVLSNNDGCIVALTPEAKAIGLHRGDPIFKVEGIVRHYGVEVFSTNMQLYAAMSKRIVSILRKSLPRVENYSIDESFCDLEGLQSPSLNCRSTSGSSFGHASVEKAGIEALMRSIADRIKLWTDIPVSIGVAPSKTIAKMGSKFAKKYKGYRSVCMIDTEEKRRKALELFDLSDVWGIGRQTFEKLNYYGIHTPLEFADKSESWVRARFSKPGIQTWLELNGVPCIDTTEVKRNKNICTSHSFGEMVMDLPSLKASIATFAASCANKLRGQQSTCHTVTAFISSNRFREDLQQYGNAATVKFVTATSDTLEITKAAIQALEAIYIPGIMYKRSGVIVGDIVPANPFQQDLFDPIQNRKQRSDLMKAVDDINRKFGTKTIHLAVTGEKDEKQKWLVKCARRTPNYLTDINELMTIRV